jgi:ribosome-associated protein
MKLAQFLKWRGAASTGGEAKLRIQAGEVLVNGEVEPRRGRQLEAGDVIQLDDQTFKFDGTTSSDAPDA